MNPTTKSFDGPAAMQLFGFAGCLTTSVSRCVRAITD